MINSHIRIVLVEPSHPGNIGGVARAMKNMGLDQLVLVSPEKFPHADATARASGAVDVLLHARVVSSLDEAITGCKHVYGTTTRSRYIEWPTLSPRDCAAQVSSNLVEGAVAIVFGRERAGLTNSELERCHSRVAIPANEEYSSLNLVCAVQVLTYELYLERISRAPVEHSLQKQSNNEPPVGAEDMDRFYEHLEGVLIELDFLNPDYPKKLMRRLKRLFNRAAPTSNEMNILRGILTAVQEQAQRYTKT